MPGPITHYLFGLETSKHIKTLPVYKIIKQYRSLYLLGLQGPDPIKYYATRKSNLSYIATLMHTDKTRDFILSAFTYIKNLTPDSPEYNECLSYMCGFICHFVLDYMLHPYIYYISGKEPSHHQKVELGIDAEFLKEKFDLDAKHLKVNKHILKDADLRSSIYNLYSETLLAIYNIEEGGALFKASYKDMRRRFSFSLASFMSKFLHSLRTLQTEESTYLNKQKRIWLHPVTGNVYTFSVEQIFHNAMKMCYGLIQSAYEYVNSDTSYDDLKYIVPNVSYLTGVLLEDKREMKYFKPS